MDGVCDPWIASSLSCSGSDACPNSAEDIDSWKDITGCSEPDNDADGFPDSADHCPGTDFTAGPNGISDSGGDEPLQPLPTFTKEDYDGVLDSDGCHDFPGDDFDGDSLSDGDEVFIFFTNPMRSDTDSDGIEDGVDGLASGGDLGTFPSTTFADAPGGTTTGIITATGGTLVTIREAPNPDGVRVKVVGMGGPATIDACGVAVTLPSGSDTIVTCGSAKVQVISGFVTVPAVETIQASVSAGSTITVSQVSPGTYSVANDPLSTSSVSVGGLTVLPGETATNLTDEDGDGWVTAADGCPALATLWAAPLGDDDCDGFTAADEGFVGTNR